MSEVKTNKISPRSGTAFTFGDSGDTFTIPSGVTIANSGTATGFGGDNTPAFQANFTTTQTLGDNVWTKMQANTEDFDTDSAYDNSTNYRFTVPSGEGGKYFLYSRMTIISSGGSSAALVGQFMQIRVNSETDTSARFFLEEQDYQGGYYKTFTLLGVTALAAADTVEFYAKSNVGSGYNSYISNDMRESVVGGYKMIGL